MDTSIISRELEGNTDSSQPPPVSAAVARDPQDSGPEVPHEESNDSEPFAFASPANDLQSNAATAAESFDFERSSSPSRQPLPEEPPAHADLHSIESSSSVSDLGEGLETLSTSSLEEDADLMPGFPIEGNSPPSSALTPLPNATEAPSGASGEALPQYVADLLEAEALERDLATGKGVPGIEGGGSQPSDPVSRLRHVPASPCIMLSHHKNCLTMIDLSEAGIKSTPEWRMFWKGFNCRLKNSDFMLICWLLFAGCSCSKVSNLRHQKASWANICWLVSRQ